MKTSIIALVLFLTAGSITAQEYKISVASPNDGRVVLKDFSGSLPIEGYSGSEIVITANKGDFTLPEKAKGLKPIFPVGMDNTGIGLDVQKTDNIITITCLIPFTRESEYKIKVPENMSVELSSGCERNNDLTIKNIKNEIAVKTCHNIKLDNVTGPLVLSTISGNIDITFSTVNSTKASSIQSVSGDIDVTLPLKTATDLDLSVFSGAIFSDFDFSESQKDMKRIGGNVTKYSLNGGGFKFSIGTISGNIYLRKGQ